MTTISHRHRRFLRRCADIARSVNNNSPWHFGGLLCNKNRVLSSGTNHPFKTHRLSMTYYKNIHCEFSCILGVPKDKLSGSTLYLVRVGNDNRANLMMARPCPHCEFALKQALIRDVFYSISDNTIGYWNLARNEEYQISQEIV